MIFTGIFLAIEAIFFALFVIGDGIGREILIPSYIWQFSVVVTAFIYVLLTFVFTKRSDELFRRRLFLLLAMACTLVSDLFLVILGQQRELAVFVFCAAQIFHALQIKRSKKRLILSFSLRFGASVVILSALAIAGALTPLYAAVAFYAPQLIGNLVEHIFDIFVFETAKKRRSILLAVGFLLFFGCDLCLGLSEIGVPEVGRWIWVFYAPSQALIAISGTFIDS